MGKYVFGTAALVVTGLFVWINYIGLTKKVVHSQDGKYTVRLASVGLINEGVILRISTKLGWPLYSRFYHWADEDGAPSTFEWFPDAVAMVNHELTAVALPSGDPLEFLSPRETEIREALRWKYSFLDYRKLVLERKDAATKGAFRIYTNEQSEGHLGKDPVWFSDFAVVFKFDDSGVREESLLRANALKAIGKSCQNPNLYRSAKATFENKYFHALRFSCHRPRKEKDTY